MNNFTKRIVISQGFNPEFFFNRIYTVNGVRYYVSVIDKASQSYFFTMEENNGKWRIINASQLPDWIIEVEKKLEDAIIEHLQEG